ncbi:hypothetical protein J8J40_24325, partial [Mycobacterium tuberculosis]|nr:hypothetical protein [Mycobacterium tuberculosis]
GWGDAFAWPNAAAIFREHAALSGHRPEIRRDFDISGLADEVALHEPILALDGGDDGLDAYRRLAPTAARALKPGGRIIVEVGAGQADGVQALLAAAGFTELSVKPDLAGVSRVVHG